MKEYYDSSQDHHPDLPDRPGQSSTIIISITTNFCPYSDQSKHKNARIIFITFMFCFPPWRNHIKFAACDIQIILCKVEQQKFGNLFAVQCVEGKREKNAYSLPPSKSNGADCERVHSNSLLSMNWNIKNSNKLGGSWNMNYFFRCKIGVPIKQDICLIFYALV